MVRTANISDDGVYRYSLGRIWQPAKPKVCFVMLNPSTADAHIDDATLRRCIGYAATWKYGGLYVLNLFALRSRDPNRLKHHPDPVGPDNKLVFKTILGASAKVVCAWGDHGKLHNQWKRAYLWIWASDHKPTALRINKSGMPAHPLYLPQDLVPAFYKPPFSL